MNISELADILGLKSYDTALPQAWVDEFVVVTGFNPVGYFVWSYDYAKIFGEPYPLNQKAFHMFMEYEKGRNVSGIR